VALDLPENVAVTRLDELASWCRKNSLWPMPFATACCGIELMATTASRYDIARFGSEAMRFSPRQADLMVVAGRVVMKMLPVLQRIWQQMLEPKWCISMGACASTGGVFDTYCVVQGIDRFIPVDMYIPGCPPRPEQLIQAVIDLQDKIQREGTIAGEEFRLAARQQPKRALVEEPGLALPRGVAHTETHPAGVTAWEAPSAAKWEAPRGAPNSEAPRGAAATQHQP
jgi:NADH-quinone oxidoreductase subunit B